MSRIKNIEILKKKKKYDSETNERGRWTWVKVAGNKRGVMELKLKNKKQNKKEMDLRGF